MIKPVLQPLILLITIFIIWFIGPLVAIDGKILLASTSVRLSVILAIALCWGLYYYFLQYPWQLSKHRKNADDRNKFTNIKPALALRHNPNLELTGNFDESLMILNKHFALVKNIIRKQFKNNLWLKFTHKTPIHLILGDKNSGKSSLLANSELSLNTIPARSKQNITLANKTQKNIYNENELEQHDAEILEICYWNLTKDQIFLDTPGSFATSEIENNNITPWMKLLNHLKSQQKNFPLQSVILTINLAEVVNQSLQQFKLTLHLLKQRILEIRKIMNVNVALNIILTHCDLLYGFKEFFANLNQSERQEKLGIVFKKQREQNLTDNFKKDFDGLLLQLNALIISRLHQEHNADKRAAMKDFPIQLDQLKERITTIVFQLAEKTFYCDAVNPIGIFFTSSVQIGYPNDLLQNILTAKLTLSNDLTPSDYSTKQQRFVNRPYFVRGLFTKILQVPESKQTIGKSVSILEKRAILGTAVTITMGFILIITAVFKTDLLRINELQSILDKNLENSDNTSLSMNVKDFIFHHYQQASYFWIFNTFPHLPAIIYTHTQLATRPTVNSLIPKLATTNPGIIITQQVATPTKAKQIIPVTALATYLVQQLQDPNSSPDNLYMNLKVYLMLTNPEHFNKDFLAHWLQTNNDPKFESIADLDTPLQAILPNSSVIKNARDILLSLPKEFLAYLILKSDFIEKQQPLVITFGGQTINIPYLFTAPGLQALFFNSYQAAVRQSFYGNWILGDLKPEKIELLLTEKSLIDLYTSAYATWWKNKYAQLKLTTITSFDQANVLFEKLAATDNGLIAFIQKFQINTVPDRILPDSGNNPLINYTRQSLQHAFGQTFAQMNAIDLNNMQSAITQMRDFLHALITASDTNAAAFSIAKQQFTQPQQQNVLNGFADYAQQLPQPLAGWFTQMSQTLWQQVMVDTQNYINSQWQNQVASVYQHQLQDHYPLFNNATTDVDLTAFSQFFNPQGIINSFYSDYLQPFIDDKQSQWQWKTVNGSTLNLSPSILYTLERARIVTTMFFPNNSQQINVQFTLQPLVMMSIIKNFKLDINGQSLNDERGSRNVSDFTWPGNANDYNTTVNILTVNGQVVTNNAAGIWGWFRILDQAQIQASNDPRRYTLTFNIDGTAAKYTLVASNLINPFIPGIIDQLRIPNSLE